MAWWSSEANRALLLLWLRERNAATCPQTDEAHALFEREPWRWDTEWEQFSRAFHLVRPDDMKE